MMNPTYIQNDVLLCESPSEPVSPSSMMTSPRDARAILVDSLLAVGAPPVYSTPSKSLEDNNESSEKLHSSYGDLPLSYSSTTSSSLSPYTRRRRNKLKATKNKKTMTKKADVNMNELGHKSWHSGDLEKVDEDEYGVPIPSESKEWPMANRRRSSCTSSAELKADQEGEELVHLSIRGEKSTSDLQTVMTATSTDQNINGWKVKGHIDSIRGRVFLRDANDDLTAVLVKNLKDYEVLCPIPAYRDQKPHKLTVKDPKLVVKTERKQKGSFISSREFNGNSNSNGEGGVGKSSMLVNPGGKKDPFNKNRKGGDDSSDNKSKKSMVTVYKWATIKQNNIFSSTYTIVNEAAGGVGGKTYTTEECGAWFRCRSVKITESKSGKLCALIRQKFEGNVITGTPPRPTWDVLMATERGCPKAVVCFLAIIDKSMATF